MLDQWGLSPETKVQLLSLSENATFRADDPNRSAPVVLRVHRPAYHSRAEIASEHSWITALRHAGTVDTPALLPKQDGDFIALFEDDGQARHVVAFEFMTGEEPNLDGDLAAGFETLGAISARLHGHVQTWPVPTGFTRKTWNHATAFGPAPLWGDWRDALGLTQSGHTTLQRLSDALREKLAQYGDGPDRFGLVHADLRLANLLKDGDRLGVIDFDDCGFSWFIYDFAAAISFYETSPIVPQLQEAWVRGYRSVNALSDAHVDMIPTFILFRRLLLTAWISSHRETETARDAGLEQYTEGTLDLAERYLTSGRI
ncbi:phosphotransferase enzyme family protein [Aliishimia ponticola]|uniref:phosphotransferase enzyme family protein n=1 Tax=Aliishimia ponticola TaxID=2499833 RepID=UPI001FE48A6A|nr:phosphotransferase [Aliishimia ponticola]